MGWGGGFLSLIWILGVGGIGRKGGRLELGVLDFWCFGRIGYGRWWMVEGEILVCSH